MPQPIEMSATTLRKLDALIAEKVMGWTWYSPGHYAMAADGAVSQWSGPGATAARHGSSWSPSTNIAHAWEVVEKIRNRPCFQMFKARIASVDFFKLSEKEACIAICEAALECAA